MEDQILDLNYVENKIKNILQREHAVHAKQEVKAYPDHTHPERLNFACPVCGDSQKSGHKKRGNLYVRNMMFKCFNCDERMSFVKLCDRFHEPIAMEDRIKLYSYLDSVKYTKANEYALDVLDRLIPLGDFVEYFNNHNRSWLIDIKPVEHNSHVYQYLKHERLIPNLDNIYQGWYQVWREGKVVYKTRVMISLNRGQDKLLGIQIRNLEKDRNQRFYKIVEFEDLYNFMHPEAPLDELEAISYNKLSHFFNILNVNFEQTVTVFEGFLDSIFYPNSIGLVGAKNDNDLLNFLTESEDDLKLQFFYDNDVTGIKKAQTMLKRGYAVFLWNKLFTKLVASKANKYEAQQKLSGIIDLNNLAQAANNPQVYTTLKLPQFFSQDEFDAVYLDKLVYDKLTRTWNKK